MQKKLSPGISSGQILITDPDMLDTFTPRMRPCPVYDHSLTHSVYKHRDLGLIIMERSQDNLPFDPPRGETENAIAQIWARLFPETRIERNSNFFDCGGNSSLVLESLSRVNQLFGTSLTISDAYMNPTLREISSCIHTGRVQDDRIDLLQEAVLSTEIIARTERGHT